MTKKTNLKRRHAEPFKQDAVRLMNNRQGKPVAQLAEELGVTAAQLYKWREQFGAAVQLPQLELVAENERLRREVRELREERDVLKKATAYFVRASR